MVPTISSFQGLSVTIAVTENDFLLPVSLIPDGYSPESADRDGESGNYRPERARKFEIVVARWKNQDFLGEEVRSIPRRHVAIFQEEQIIYGDYSDLTVRTRFPFERRLESREFAYGVEDRLSILFQKFLSEAQSPSEKNELLARVQKLRNYSKTPLRYTFKVLGNEGMRNPRVKELNLMNRRLKRLEPVKSLHLSDANKVMFALVFVNICFLFLVGMTSSSQR